MVDFLFFVWVLILMENLRADLVQDSVEVGGAGQLRALDCFLVGLEHTVTAVDKRLFITVEIPEATGLGLSHVVGDSTEAKSLELSVLGVRRHHITHLKDSLFVLVRFFLALSV